MERAGPNEVRRPIDLRECTFMDSSGLAWLIDTKRAAHAQHGSVVLVAPSHPVKRLLEVCGLIEHFSIEPATSTDGSP